MKKVLFIALLTIVSPLAWAHDHVVPHVHAWDTQSALLLISSLAATLALAWVLFKAGRDRKASRKS